MPLPGKCEEPLVDTTAYTHCRRGNHGWLILRLQCLSELAGCWDSPTGNPPEVIPFLLLPMSFLAETWNVSREQFVISVSMVMCCQRFVTVYVCSGVVADT